MIAAPDWKKLTANQKKQAFKDDEYLKFISRGWYMSVSDMSFLDSESSISKYGNQTPHWVKSVLAIYPDDTPPYLSKYRVDQPFTYKAITLKGLKEKLTTALTQAQNVQNTCKSE